MANDFAVNQYKRLNHEGLLPKANIGYVRDWFKGKNEGRELILINIREHVANSNARTTLKDYEPLIAYCKANGYLIIDVSHEKKSFSNELNKWVS